MFFTREKTWYRYGDKFSASQHAVALVFSSSTINFYSESDQRGVKTARMNESIVFVLVRNAPKKKKKMSVECNEYVRCNIRSYSYFF